MEFHTLTLVQPGFAVITHNCWPKKSRIHLPRNLLQRVPPAHQGMVTAALSCVFAKENAGEILSRWDDMAASLAERLARAVS
jgi:transposase-like protein